MPVIRSKHDKEHPYVMLLQATLQRGELSLRAIGLWAYCMSFKEDWIFYVNDLKRRLKLDGITSIRTALKELEAAGLASLEHKRGEHGRMAGATWLLYESPEQNPHFTQASSPPEAASAKRGSSAPRSAQPADGAPARRRSQPAANLDLTNNNTHQLSTRNQYPTTTNAETGANPGLAAALMAEGVSESIAYALIQAVGPEQVGRQLVLLNTKRVAGKGPKDPAAWLVEACRKDYAGDKDRAQAATEARLMTLKDALAELHRRGIEISATNPMDQYLETVPGEGKALFRLTPLALGKPRIGK